MVSAPANSCETEARSLWRVLGLPPDLEFLAKLKAIDDLLAAEETPSNGAPAPCASVIRLRTPAASRKRRYRARQRNGEIVLKVPAHEHELAAALIASGRLREAAAMDRAALEKAVNGIVGQWIDSWVRRPG
jgi:hypothetical protein